jgi:cytochrome c-type biogenesis protein CcmH/NrfG
MILASRRQKLTAALQVAKTAVQQFPDSYHAYQLKGLVETRLKYYQNSVQSYVGAYQLTPSAADVNVGLAVAQWGADISKGWSRCDSTEGKEPVPQMRNEK